MNPISPKVTIPGLVGLGLVVVYMAIGQYLPTYAPSAALAGAITTFATALAAIITPHENTLMRITSFPTGLPNDKQITPAGR